MRTTLSLLALAGALAGPAAAHAAPGDVALRARTVQCLTGQDAEQRSVTFTASMPRRDGAVRLQMRFSLHQRLDRARTFKRVRGVPGWDRWETSAPGRRGFVLTRRVQELAAPAAYRATVRFRWLDADGRVIRRATRRTRTCEQPDPRPDLRLGGLTAVPEGAVARYRLAVRNDGLGPASSFGVVLVVGGQLQPAVTVGAIPGRSERIVEVVAPPCAPGSPVEVLLDTEGAVHEARESDNAQVRRCPLGATGGGAYGARMGSRP